MKNQETKSTPTDSKQRSGKGLLSTDLLSSNTGGITNLNQLPREVLSVMLDVSRDVGLDASIEDCLQHVIFDLDNAEDRRK